MMSTATLKLQIIDKVNSLTDEVVLEEIYRLISLEAEVDSIYRLTDDEKKGIEIGLNDIRKGHIYTSEQADGVIREWLKR